MTLALGIGANTTMFSLVNSVLLRPFPGYQTPQMQDPVRFTYLLVRTDRDPLSLASTVRHAVYSESPLTQLDEMRSMEDRAAYLTAASRRAMWLLSVFAGLAGILSATGIYAVSAYFLAVIAMMRPTLRAITMDIASTLRQE